uniref:FYVE-type domain-containing protein n=1 Tax=Macrostomum lignano TaxID=282301 RepID=A0A1I8I2T2_9PLAT
RRHNLLMKFCKADRKLLDLEMRVGFCALYLEFSGLKKRHNKVMKRVIELMDELIPDKETAQALPVQVNIDSIVLNLAIGLNKFPRNSFMIAIVALRGQLTPGFLNEHQGLAAKVNEAAEDTFQMLRQEFGRSFHGGDPIHNQLEKFDRFLSKFELAWICDGTNPDIVEALLDIQALSELFLRAASWAVEQNCINPEDFATCEPEIMTTLPRLAVLLYISESTVDQGSGKVRKVFREHREGLDEARKLLHRLEPQKRKEVAQRLCLRTDARDPEINRLFRAIASAADQLQTNHPIECTYLMSYVCSKYSSEPQAEGCSGGLLLQHRAVGAVPDSASTSCTSANCGVEFSLLQHRHHCRSCGGTFCSHCTTHKMPLPLLGHHSPVRVCEPCRDKVLASMLTKEAPEWVPDCSSPRCSNGGCR